MLHLLVVFALALSATNGQQGPGLGPWELRSPESQGLNSTELALAADRVFAVYGDRRCFIVVKNGYIVAEEYYNGWDISSTKEAFSTTKSQCATLFGIAVAQGWANEEDYVRDRIANTLNCNPDAQFKHVLTMTGTSANISVPEFRYDTLGLLCLDTVSAFIEENNPEGLTTEQWKDKYWHEGLGLEHSEWVNGDPPLEYLQCGYSSQMSCRDLARSSLLWMNEGEWAGVQVVDRDFILAGRTSVYPDSDVGEGIGYGYLVWRFQDGDDPVDPNVHSFAGAEAQCATISKEHEALVVTMGTDEDGQSCSSVWPLVRDSIVSQR